VKSVPVGHWKDEVNHRIFFEGLKERFNIKKPQDWGKVTIRQVQQVGGGGLLLTSLL
jgi:hypothetical protein